MILNAMTKYGAVEGVATASEGISVFKGVPFAAPPVGELRWRAPQPVTPWEGVLKCDKYKPAAMQCQPSIHFYIDEFPIDFSAVEYSEDCLYLNIWTPAKTAGDKLPVMMWIHGGGNEVGFPHELEHDGEYLAQRGVIYVSVTYRLNVFGFLAHPELTAESEYGASGNYGNLDNLAALKWLRENIAAFGGDPDNITVFGQSAGAGNTQTLCASPLAKGEMNRAIIMSGGSTPLGRAAGLAETEALGLEFQNICGCKNIAELRALPAHMIFAYMKTMGMKTMGFSTCVDGYLLEKDSGEALNAGELHDISYLVGTVKNEGATMKGFFAPTEPYTLETLKARLESTYPGNAEKALEMYGITTDAEAAAFDGDLHADGMVRGANLWAELQLKLGRAPIYRYIFDREIPAADGTPCEEGAFHSSDIWYVHGTIDRSWRGMSEADRKTTDYMMDYWTNFARTGDPNGDGLPEWIPYTAESKKVMRINENAGMSDLGGHPAMTLL